MTPLLGMLESAVRLALLAGFAAGAMTVFRVKNAETQFRVWTLVMLAGLALPFAPSLWALPIALDTVGPIADLRFPIQIFQSAITDSQSPNAASRFPILDVLWLVVPYVAITAFLLVRIAVGWIWTLRLTRSAHPVDGQTFLESDRVEVPVTVGLFHPVIIVPTTWRRWPADILATVLAHEGDHAARRDGLWLTLGVVHRAMHWMNPLSWWLSRRLTELSERASDDAALMQGVAPTRYAEILLTFATTVAATHRRVAWVVPMARHSASDTESRLLRILSWKGRAPMTRARLLLLAVILVAGSVTLYMTSFSSLSDLPADEQPMIRFVTRNFQPEDNANFRHPPIALTRVRPRYTAAGMRAQIQGTVELEIEVSAVGHVTSAKVIKSLDPTHGLDDAALEAVKQWAFAPGTVSGKPRASTAVVHMDFTLR